MSFLTGSSTFSSSIYSCCLSLASSFFLLFSSASLRIIFFSFSYLLFILSRASSIYFFSNAFCAAIASNFARFLASKSFYCASLAYGYSSIGSPSALPGSSSSSWSPLPPSIFISIFENGERTFCSPAYGDLAET